MTTYSLKETMDTLLLRIQAGYPLIYIVSHEESRVMDYLSKIIQVIRAPDRDAGGRARGNPGKNLLRWQMGSGLQRFNGFPAPPATAAKSPDWLKLPGLPEGGTWQPPETPSATAALERIRNAGVRSPDNVVEDSVVVFFDIHHYLQGFVGGSAELVRPMRNTADALRQYYDAQRHTPAHPYKTVVVIAPTRMVSNELERDLIIVDFPLPEKNELVGTLGSMCRSRVIVDRPGHEMKIPPVLLLPDPIPEADLKAVFPNGPPAADVAKEYLERLSDMIAGSGSGLTLEDYKLGLNGFAVRGGYLSPKHIDDMLNLKAKAISDDALHYTPKVEVTLGGLEHVKHWVDTRQGAVVSDKVRKDYHLPSPKGLLLCGVSGGGKSELAKFIAAKMNLALLRLDVGALFGKYVGESEEHARRALQLAEVLAPVVLWMDEIDKAFTGTTGGGDGGVATRLFGYFLTWMAEKKDSVFVVATANDFQRLLTEFPEFGRKGRFDEIMWVPLPDAAARKEIFKIYLSRHSETDDKYLKVDHDDVDALHLNYPAVVIPNRHNGSALDRLCALLSDNSISQDMTGAEIEYAIVSALYSAYEEDQKSLNRSRFTPDLLLRTVLEARNRCLYHLGGQDRVRLITLEKAVVDRNWPVAGAWQAPVAAPAPVAADGGKI